MIAQPDVNTCAVNSSDVQSSGYQEQQANVTEAIPDLKSSTDSVSVPCVNVAITSDNIPMSRALPPSENAIGTQLHL